MTFKVSYTVVFLLAAAIAYSSCKKTDNQAIPGPSGVPYSFQEMPVVNIYPLAYPKFADDVWGILLSCRTSGDLTDTASIAHRYNKNWMTAIFMSNGSAWQAGGDVSVNGIQLPDGVKYSYPYMLVDTMNIWQAHSMNNWTVSGNDIVPAFSANVEGTIPQFTGTLPLMVSRSKGISLKFDASTVANADQGFIATYYGGDYNVSNAVSTNGGVATIPGYDGDYIPSQQTFEVSSIFSRSDTAVFSQGCIMVVLYNSKTGTFNGKKMAFVNQREVLGVVKFID